MLLLNLKQDSTYYMATDANLSMIEKINGVQHLVSTLISGKLSHKVVSIKDSVYQMEVQYLRINMHMEVEGKKIDFDSSDKVSQNMVSKIASKMVNRPFLMTIDKRGKVLEIKNMENVYAEIFADFPQITASQKAQIKAQLEKTFGEEAIKSSFQNVFTVYPDKEIGLNDQWVAKTKFQTTILANIITTYTLKGITDKIYKIHGDAVIQADGNGAFITRNNIPIRFINVNGTSTTDVQIDLTTGWIKESKMSTAINGIMEAKDSPATPGGLTFPVSVVVDMEMSDK